MILFKILKSPRLTVGLLVYFFLLLLSATLMGLDKTWTTYFFLSPIPFPGLPAVFLLGAVNILFSMIFMINKQRKTKLNLSFIGILLLHIILVLSLFLGAFGQNTTQEYVLGIVQGDSADSVFKQSSSVNGAEPKELGFIIKLERFDIISHTGTKIPADYQSVLKIMPKNSAPFFKTISMNKPLRYEGWNFYQSGYQIIDQKPASIFLITRNSWGWAPYLSGVIIFISFILILLGRIRQ